MPTERYEAKIDDDQTGLTELIGMVELIGRRYTNELKKNFRLCYQRRKWKKKLLMIYCPL
jgi:hypothetical protein